MPDQDRRVVCNPTKMSRIFRVMPACDDTRLDAERYISAARFFLGLPQLLRLSPAETVQVDVPHADALGPAPDFSYEADACRQCPGQICDRHLNHAHACRTSAARTIDGRHELVKNVRFRFVGRAGFADVDSEPRTDAAVGDQRRADVFYVDRETPNAHIHYYTDDTIGHPLCSTHLPGENKDPYHTLGKLEKKKETDYKSKLANVRLQPSVLMGYRRIVFWPCAYTSLGDLGKATVKAISSMCGFAKLKARLESRRRRRPDGLSPQEVTKLFRQEFMDQLYIALAKGNALIALAVGL